MDYELIRKGEIAEGHELVFYHAETNSKLVVMVTYAAWASAQLGKKYKIQFVPVDE